MKFLARFLATVGYVGHAPVAPGTAGSLAALPIIWFIYPRLSAAGACRLVLAICAVAIWAAHQQASDEKKDPQYVVIDELMGQMVALLFIPLDFFTIAAGFVLFRIFDVFKPFPSRQSEKLPGGWGIVMDDVVAGIYANIVLQIFILLFENS
jgi:phosphatidylglycerophosphatase A